MGFYDDVLSSKYAWYDQARSLRNAAERIVDPLWSSTNDLSDEDFYDETLSTLPPYLFMIALAIENALKGALIGTPGHSTILEEEE